MKPQVPTESLPEFFIMDVHYSITTKMTVHKYLFQEESPEATVLMLNGEMNRYHLNCAGNTLYEARKDKNDRGVWYTLLLICTK